MPSPLDELFRGAKAAALDDPSSRAGRSPTAAIAVGACATNKALSFAIPLISDRPSTVPSTAVHAMQVDGADDHISQFLTLIAFVPVRVPA